MKQLLKSSWYEISLLILLNVVSIAYIATDFKVHEANTATRIFSATQAFFTIVMIVSLCLATRLGQIAKKCAIVIRFVLYLLVSILQFAPIFFWFLFDGSLINEINTDGVTGHWGFAVCHMILVVWCVLNVIVIFF